MRNFCCISKRSASQRFNLFPACLLEGRADMVGLRSFRTVYCDIPLALINVMFLSTLLSLLLLLSHILKGCVFHNCYRVLFLNEDTNQNTRLQSDVCKIFPVCMFVFFIKLDLCYRKLKHSKITELLFLYIFFFASFSL